MNPLLAEISRIFRVVLIKSKRDLAIRVCVRYSLNFTSDDRVNNRDK